MPVKKGASKRGKTAVKVESKTDSEDLKLNKDQNEQDPNATFTVDKNADGEKSGHSSSDGEGAENAVSKREGQIAKLGNGEAQELDKIEEADEDDVKESPKAKPKGRAVSKKNKRAESEPEPKETQVEEEDTAPGSPKRPHDEDSEDDKAEEIPAKRGRVKGEKKAPAAKKQPKAKAEREPAADDGGEDEDVSAEEAAADSADEVAPTKRGRAGNAAAKNKKVRKGKVAPETEPTEPEATTNKSSPEEESPVEMDDGDNAAEVAKEVKPTKKRAAARAPKEKAVPQPSTRATRSRKVVTYEEPANDEDESEEDTKKKPKKGATTKKAPGPAKKAENTAPKAAKKGRGRAPKTAPKEEEDDEVDE